jgi:hypothetical protein
MQFTKCGSAIWQARPLPFSAVEVPAPLPVPGASVLIEAWVYAP